MNTELAGLGRMVVFDLRRSWVRMLVWALVLAVLVVTVVEYQKTTFPTQADRDAYAAIANTPSVSALTGLPYAAATAGGILNIKLWMSNAIALALVSVFLVTRHGRAEEESGRAELLRSAAIGRHAISVAGWIVAALFALVAGLLCGGAAIAVGLPAGGSLLMGLSFTGVAVSFIGVAAVTGQLASTGRAANSWAALVLAAAYLVRALADVNAEGETPQWTTWLSPIGWGQQTRSFGENQWWVLILPVVFAGLCGTLALALESRRDLGAGIIPARPGPVHASALLGRTPLGATFGLPLRLQRTSLIAWTLGVAFAGLFFGGIAKLMEDLVTRLGSSPIGDAITGGSDTPVDGLLGFLLLFTGVLVAGFAVQSTLALRSDETAHGEVEWSTAVSRRGWAGARVAIPAIASAVMLVLGGLMQGASYGAQTGDPAQAWRFAAAGLAYWPTVALVIAVVAALAAVVPRAAAAISWAVYGVLVLLAALGDVLGIPHDVVQATPFWAVPQPGRPDPSWAPVWLMAAGAVVVAALALWRYRERDLASE